MALPKEPRQKMINLMYLVLTALLALNVSAEILNAFKTVDNSLTGTNKTITQSTGTIMSSFEEKLTDPTTRVKAEMWRPKALQAQQLSTDLYNYIDNLKKQVLKEADFDPARKGDSTFKEDNQDIATRLLVDGKAGKELQQKLIDYQKAILALAPTPEMRAELQQKLQINTQMPPLRNHRRNETWAGAYFRMVPTVAAVTILSKFQNDVKTSENRVIAHFHEQVGKVIVRYDTYTAIVGQSSNYLMPGGEIEVMAGVGAFSRAAAPQITINGQSASLGDDGAARAKFAAGSIGQHTIPVNIVYVDLDGNRQSISKTIEYTVGQANAAISLDKMNVLYIGVDNPVTIAASGGAEQIVPSIAGGAGSITKVGPGKYTVRVGAVTDDCRISVSVNGKNAGTSQFRVRTIPDPVASVGNQLSGSNFNAGAFRAQGGVAASIKDFPFDIKYSVTSFLISTDTDDGDIVEARVQGNSFGDAQNVMRQVKPQKTVYIDEIYAVGPDGRRRHLPSLMYYIK
jgi:gliding motility-associated protein GldM